METPPPVEALKGVQLNELVDKYMSEGVDTSLPLADLVRQRQELVYIHAMARAKETRLDFDEYGMVYGMIHALDDAIKQAKKSEFTPEEREKMPIWMRKLLEDSNL